MRNFYLLVFLPFFSAKLIAQITPAQLEASVKAGIDPYFVYSKDTVSEKGPKCIVRSVLEDRKGNIWLASWQGIIKYDGKKFTNYTLKDNLIKFHVFSIFEDSKGNLWFSTVRGGVYRFNPTEESKGHKAFTLFTTNDGLGDNSTDCIREDQQGNIWFSGKNVSCYNGKSFKVFGKADGSNNEQVNAILADKSGRIWVGGDKGIDVYDPAKKTFSRFLSARPLERIASLFQDKDGNIWIGTFTGFFRYDFKTGMQDQSPLDSIAGRLVMYLCQDHNGKIWFAYNDSKPDNFKFAFTLYKLDPLTGSKIKILEQKDPPGFAQIFNIIEDQKGFIWYGSANGAYRLDVRYENHPCNKGSCDHQGTLRQAEEEHEKEKAKFLTNFTK